MPGDGVRVPHADVCETADAWFIEIDVPGVAAQDLQLRFEPGQIVCEGKRESRSMNCECRCHAVEIETGTFRRAIPLPAEIDGDAIEARLELGVLQVRVPKTKRQNVSRRIEIL